uniref:Uncharacterized protein n=1 Tax=Eutreptiella gymnastica TaxID=73025 RepID=A0A7S4FYK3_9EUGL
MVFAGPSVGPIGQDYCLIASFKNVRHQNRMPGTESGRLLGWSTVLPYAVGGIGSNPEQIALGNTSAKSTANFTFSFHRAGPIIPYSCPWPFAALDDYVVIFVCHDAP